MSTTTNLLISLDKSLGDNRYKVVSTETYVKPYREPVLIPRLGRHRADFEAFFYSNHKDLWCMYSYIIEALYENKDISFKVTHTSFFDFSKWVWKYSDHSVFK